MKTGSTRFSALVSVRFFQSLMAALVLLFMVGCAGKAFDQETAERVEIGSIVVLPVEIIVADKNEPVSQTKTLQLAEGRETLDRFIGEYFSGKESIRILSEDEIEAMPDQSFRNPAARARSISKATGQDAVLLVTLHAYQKRQGTTYSVDTPPSVTFDYKLIMAETGRELCSGLFQETQQPLSSNIFNFFTAKKRGFKWITAEELAREGIRSKFDSCLYLR